MNRGLLLQVPTQTDLERLYHELAQIGAKSVGRASPWSYQPQNVEELLGLAGEMLRYDARLLSILLELLLARWSEWNPLALRRVMAEMAWPQALLVVTEFAREVSHDPELRYFTDYLAAGWRRVDPAERFFLEGDRPGSRMGRRRSGRSLTAYSRWGFLGTERPSLSTKRKVLVGRYDAATRERIRHALLERRGTFTMAEYLQAVDHSVTRQQAYQDLASDRELVVVGRGRSARWTRRAGQALGIDPRG